MPLLPVYDAVMPARALARLVGHVTLIEGETNAEVPTLTPGEVRVFGSHRTMERSRRGMVTRNGLVVEGSEIPRETPPGEMVMVTGLESMARLGRRSYAYLGGGATDWR